MQDADHNQDLRPAGTQAPSRPSAPGGYERTLAQALAHDLRAPLRAIDEFAGRLAQRPGLDEQGRLQVRRIREAGARMAHLLDAWQEFSAAGQAPLRSQVVDLSLLADWVGAELQDAAPEREARIRVQPGLAVRGDEYYLKRLLAQLMDNAWKFSATRERVEIDLEGEREHDTVRLRLRDRGIGFEPRYADKLLQPFQRLHGPDEGAGSGLGLAIAQCIAERHGGRIRAESVPGEGSMFHVELRDLKETGGG